ncbi:hypothetical protein J6590_000577 [Homalodisca vitripennis]|nr:hypothetical protein J6590_000577 [Homalodisca vitripennis]
MSIRVLSTGGCRHSTSHPPLHCIHCHTHCHTMAYRVHDDCVLWRHSLTEVPVHGCRSPFIPLEYSGASPSPSHNAISCSVTA